MEHVIERETIGIASRNSKTTKWMREQAGVADILDSIIKQGKPSNAEDI